MYTLMTEEDRHAIEAETKRLTEPAALRENLQRFSHGSIRGAERVLRMRLADFYENADPVQGRYLALLVGIAQEACRRQLAGTPACPETDQELVELAARIQQQAAA